MSPPRRLLPRLRAALQAAGDPTRALAMQAYMKSEMPYWGVAAPRVRALCRELFASYPFEDAARWRADVLALWRSATHREERYAALELAGHRKAKAFQTLEALPMYEEMIVSGAWWDYVDELASHAIGTLLELYPRELRRTLRDWSRGDDLWRRRAAILAQLGFGEATDTKLLYACIRPSLSSREFFLRKAIGWALRQLARSQPEEVLRYVEEHADQLSPLSRREALKHLSPRGQGITRGKGAASGGNRRQ
jgi:3-methyladenine DNA glycosylase AlkD